MIDLHIHTVNSDGDFTVKEILKEAEKRNLKTIAITDHNSISSYEDLKNSKIRTIFSGEIIIASELDFVKYGKSFEILGYGLDLDKMKNSEIIKKNSKNKIFEIQRKNLEFLKRICDNLRITYSKDLTVKTANNMAHDVILDDIIKFEENKEILEKFGITDRGSFYRGQVCNENSPFYIDNTKGKFDIFYVVNLVHEAGGKAFLAHPFAYRLPNIKEILDEIVSLRIIDGIECYHRKHDKNQIKFLEQYCEENNLLKSGGSDKHTAENKMGHASNGETEIPDSLIEDWVSEVKKI